MIQLIIKEGRVVAYHEAGQNVLKAYPDNQGFEVVNWAGDISFLREASDTGKPALDPRSDLQKQQDANRAYIRKRNRAYPLDRRLLMLLYQDQKNGTNKFVEVIDQVNSQFPGA